MSELETKYAIEVDKVTKIYKLYDKAHRQAERIFKFFPKEYHKDFYALNELSFHVKKGQTVGIIGTNVPENLQF